MTKPHNVQPIMKPACIPFALAVFSGEGVKKLKNLAKKNIPAPRPKSSNKFKMLKAVPLVSGTVILTSKTFVELPANPKATPAGTTYSMVNASDMGGISTKAAIGNAPNTVTPPKISGISFGLVWKSLSTSIPAMIAPIVIPIPSADITKPVTRRSKFFSVAK
mmetsp:Transcript_2595/g.3725  ORF Transcript_2595/g.3725 Transcript_2595/m.3725 type:complete len:163 (+) Transcript_2595:2064-2552(+)